MASSTYGSAARLCTICLDSVSDDNRRGKAELICGHLFHLDCIGSEFNYRGEMKCPNCRVIENGEWLLPDDDDSLIDEENHRLEIQAYSHDVRDTTSTFRGQLVINPTIHYHQRTVVVPPPLALGGNATAVSQDPLVFDALRRASGGPHGSNSMQRSIVEHAVPQNSPNAEEVRAYYHSSSYQQNLPSPTIVDTMLMHEKINQSTLEPTNMARFESLSAYDGRDPSTELRLNDSSSENQLAHIFEEQQHGIHEHSGDGADR